MKKRTIWIIMLSFMGLTLLLNIGLRKKMIRGEWIGFRQGDTTSVYLQVFNNKLFWLEGDRVDTCDWTLSQKDGALYLSTQNGTSLHYYVQFPTFDSLLIQGRPFTAESGGVDSLKQGYRFHRVDRKEWRKRTGRRGGKG